MKKENINVEVIQSPYTYDNNDRIIIHLNEDINAKLGDEIVIETEMGYGVVILTAYILRKETDGEEK